MCYLVCNCWSFLCLTVKCLKCNYASTTFQHFQDMILDIRKASKVEEAMDQYFSKERLDGDNSYKCEKCKCLVPATKKFSIERPPKVLCIQLKRCVLLKLSGISSCLLSFQG